MVVIEFSVAKDCVHCGECVAVCPVRVLGMSRRGQPVVIRGRDDFCLDCQHCLAVCPVAALSIQGRDPAKSMALDNLPAAEQMEQLIRGRRSVRQYKAESVEPEVMDRLLQVVSCAPTGKNNRSTQFWLVDDHATMDKVRTAFMEGIRNGVAKGSIQKESAVFEGFLRLWDERGIDVLFRGAPHLIVASSPKESPTPQADCLISLSYFELFAQSLGLGTVWDGYALWVMNIIAPELRTLLGIPHDHVIGYVMAFGKPAVRYRRAPQHSQLPVHRVAL